MLKVFETPFSTVCVEGFAGASVVSVKVFGLVPYDVRTTCEVVGVVICIGSVRNFVLRFSVQGGDVSILAAERGGDAQMLIGMPKTCPFTGSSLSLSSVTASILRGRTIARTEISLFKAASCCCAAIFSRANRSISCSQSRSLRLSTWMYLIAEPSIDKLEVFLSSGVAGSCLFNSSKHSFKWALRFFSSLLWTSLVPARGALPLLPPLLLFPLILLPLPLLLTDGGEGI